MRTFRDAKSMAKALRQGLQERELELTHSDCLELVARQFGCHDWNELAARLAGGSEAKPSTQIKVPAGWVASGSTPDLYDMGIDQTLPGAPAVIRCKVVDGAVSPAGFGTLMQSVLADPVRGQRLRLKAGLKAKDVDGAGTLWMRVDRAPGDTLRFDNMEQRPRNGVLKGTTEWTEREVVLDVPLEATSIHFGFYLRGRGQLWARQFDLAAVEQDTAVTSANRSFLDRPTNLDFREPEPE